MVSVDAPCRILMSGQSIFSAVPVTFCCEVAVEPEKKLEILSLTDGGLDVAVAVLVVAGVVPRRLVPEQPDAKSARNSSVAIDKRSPGRITGRIAGCNK